MDALIPLLDYPSLGLEQPLFIGTGEANRDVPPAMQAAFVRHDGFQCGYCTPGQICLAVGLQNQNLLKTIDDIRELMSGTICRCGAYTNIVAAVQEVSGAEGAAK